MLTHATSHLANSMQAGLRREAGLLLAAGLLQELQQRLRGCPRHLLRLQRSHASHRCQPPPRLLRRPRRRGLRQREVHGLRRRCRIQDSGRRLGCERRRGPVSDDCGRIPRAQAGTGKTMLVASGRAWDCSAFGGCVCGFWCGGFGI